MIYANFIPKITSTCWFFLFFSLKIIYENASLIFILCSSASQCTSQLYIVSRHNNSHGWNYLSLVKNKFTWNLCIYQHNWRRQWNKRYIINFLQFVMFLATYKASATFVRNSWNSPVYFCHWEWQKTYLSNYNMYLGLSISYLETTSVIKGYLHITLHITFFIPGIKSAKLGLRSPKYFLLY